MREVAPLASIHTSHRSTPVEPNELKSDIEETTRSAKVSQVSRRESKEIQAQKPLYDGYIIAPGVFQNMLSDERRQSSAHAHFHATSHLRRGEDGMVRLKRDIFTMTDSIGNAEPIAPDIFFNLKFDTRQKDREEGENEESFLKDFVNVADLQGPAVDEILRMIEHEQDKRTGTFVPITKRKHPQSETRNPQLNSDLSQQKVIARIRSFYFIFLILSIFFSRREAKK